MKGNKRAQEEMVGFVMVVIVVAVIFLVFLGIFMRQGDDRTTESAEVSQFLSSLVDYTTNCTFNGYNYLELGELVEECYENQGKECDGEDNVCELLEATAGEAIESAWVFGTESVIKGYYVNGKYIDDVTGSITDFSEIGSPCAGRMRGSEVLIDAFDGRIVLSLELCLS